MTMELRKGLPPNYPAIAAAFPAARAANVIFAYGDIIYTSSGKEIGPHLRVHEQIHGDRQSALGVEEWWERYLIDPDFRYHEELLAHRAEYKSMTESAFNRNQRRAALKIVAQRLASPLYGIGGGWQRAAKDIKNEKIC